MTSTENIRKEFNWKKRQEIRKAKSKLEISETQDFEDIFFSILDSQKVYKNNKFLNKISSKLKDKLDSLQQELNKSKIADSVHMVWLKK